MSLNGFVYEVEATLVGQNVMLRYDPGAPSGRPVQVWHERQQIQLARPLDAYANCFVKRHRLSGTATADTPAPEPPPSGLNLRELPNPEDPKENR